MPRQPQRIIPELRETFIKRYIAERTSNAERDQKNGVGKRNVVRRIYGTKNSWKGHKDRTRHKSEIKRSGQARLVLIMSKTSTATSPPCEGELAGEAGYWTSVRRSLAAGFKAPQHLLPTHKLHSVLVQARFSAINCLPLGQKETHNIFFLNKREAGGGDLKRPTYRWKTGGKNVNTLIISLQWHQSRTKHVVVDLFIHLICIYLFLLYVATSDKSAGLKGAFQRQW